jgi:microcystin degradation protein MlrC
MPPRIAVGLLMQESNSFSPLPTTVETFESYYVYRGDELLTRYGEARTEVPGFLSVLAAAGAEPVPLLAAYATASGTVTRDAFDTLVGEMEGRLRAALPVDGLLLALHGALVVEDQPDGDGEIIARLRRVLPPEVPIGVSLDLHGHLTPLMLQPGVFHIGYREYPHIDMFETGERTARVLLDVVAGRRRLPAMALAKRPMIVSPVSTRTTDGPLRPVVEEARRMEANGEAINAALFPVQPWIDVPDLGFAALVCADDQAVATAAAERLADMAWERRADFFPDLTPLEEAIRIGLASEGTTVVSDAGDAPTGGSAADSAAVLKALLAAGVDRASRQSCLTLCDPEAVRIATAAGVGATVRLALLPHGRRRPERPGTVHGADRGPRHRCDPRPRPHPPLDRMGPRHVHLAGHPARGGGARLRQVAVPLPAELRPDRGAYHRRQHAGPDRPRHAPHPLHESDAAALSSRRSLTVLPGSR